MSETKPIDKQSPETAAGPKVLNGSEIVIECLKEQGVKTVRSEERRVGKECG